MIEDVEQVALDAPSPARRQLASRRSADDAFTKERPLTYDRVPASGSNTPPHQWCSLQSPSISLALGFVRRSVVTCGDRPHDPV